MWVSLTNIMPLYHWQPISFLRTSGPRGVESQGKEINLTNPNLEHRTLDKRCLRAVTPKATHLISTTPWLPANTAEWLCTVHSGYIHWWDRQITNFWVILELPPPSSSPSPRKVCHLYFWLLVACHMWSHLTRIAIVRWKNHSAH